LCGTGVVCVIERVVCCVCTPVACARARTCGRRAVAHKCALERIQCTIAMLEVANKAHTHTDGSAVPLLCWPSDRPAGVLLARRRGFAGTHTHTHTHPGGKRLRERGRLLRRSRCMTATRSTLWWEVTGPPVSTDTVTPSPIPTDPPSGPRERRGLGGAPCASPQGRPMVTDAACAVADSAGQPKNGLQPRFDSLFCDQPPPLGTQDHLQQRQCLTMGHR